MRLFSFKYISAFVTISAVILASCKPDLDDPELERNKIEIRKEDDIHKNQFGGSDPNTPNGNEHLIFIKQGLLAFDSYCKECHQSVTDSEVKLHNSAAILEAIKNVGQMEKLSTVSKAEINLIAYALRAAEDDLAEARSVTIPEDPEIGDETNDGDPEVEPDDEFDRDLFTDPNFGDGTDPSFDDDLFGGNIDVPKPSNPSEAGNEGQAEPQTPADNAVN